MAFRTTTRNKIVGVHGGPRTRLADTLPDMQQAYARDCARKVKATNKLDMLDAWFAGQDLNQPGSIIGFPGFKSWHMLLDLASGARMTLGLVPRACRFEMFHPKEPGRPARPNPDDYERIGTLSFAEPREPMALVVRKIKAHGGLAKAAFIFKPGGELAGRVLVWNTARNKAGALVDTLELHNAEPGSPAPAPAPAQGAAPSPYQVAKQSGLDAHFAKLVILLFAV